MAENEKASTVLLLAMYVRGQSQLGLDLVRAAEQAATAGRPPFDRAVAVERLADPARFPAVARVIAAGVFADESAGEAYPDDEFEFGLQRILDGVAALDRSRVPG